MPKSAIIVESPTKTRTLARFLGDRYLLLASKGHVRDLPEEGLAVDVAHDFAPTYEIIPRQKKTVADLRKRLADVDCVYLASDPDREGEAIAWELAEALKLKDPLRIEFNEITEQAVKEALEHPGRINYNRVNAQQARRILDRLVGYKLSPLLWARLRSRNHKTGALSAGRVQSVALRLICDREREIAAFVAEEYWSVEALLSPEGLQVTFPAQLKTREGREIALTTWEETEPVVAELQRLAHVVAQVERKPVRRNPAPPFITSTLQRAGAGQLGMAARQTMRVAQQLYEGLDLGEGTVGLITYMRTDSTRISDQARQQAVSFIESSFGKDYIGPGVRGKIPKGAQEAHEAIRPTEVTRTPQMVAPHLSEEQARLYELIWRRFVASQMAPAVYDQTGVDITAGPYGLRTTASVLKFPGFQAVMPEKPSDEEQATLPELQPGQPLDCHEVTPEQHFTKPPARFNEGSLIAALEENGIGRPSTYAPIIETLRQRKYVRMQQRAFVPTPLGFGVCDFFVDNFPRIMNIEFTAHVEADLDTVENGETEWVEVLRNFYADFEGLLEQVEKAGPRVVEGESCPKCGGALQERYSAFGKFIGCQNYPECDYTRNLVPETIRPEKPPELEESCPECDSKLVVRTGFRGRKFVGCSAYPKCAYKRQMEGEAGATSGEAARPEPEKLDEACPDCGKPLLIRTARQGSRFVGCSGYPKCRYTRNIPGEPRAARARKPAVKTELPCDECGKPLVLRVGRRGPFLGCSGYPKCRSTRNATPEELAKYEPQLDAPPAEEKAAEPETAD